MSLTIKPDKCNDCGYVLLFTDQARACWNCGLVNIHRQQHFSTIGDDLTTTNGVSIIDSEVGGDITVISETPDDAPLKYDGQLDNYGEGLRNRAERDEPDPRRVCPQCGWNVPRDYQPCWVCGHNNNMFQ